MKIAAFVSVLLVSSVSSASADSWTVNSTLDRVDVTPGDGICSTGATVGGVPECTLRAAVQEANARRFALPRVHNIQVPAGLYRLTIEPFVVEEDQQRIGTATSDVAIRTGDLDINIPGDLNITGDGPGLTIIDGGALDRVFDVWSQYSREVRFQQMTIQNGRSLGPGGCVNHRGGRTGVFLGHVSVEGCTSFQQIGGGMSSSGFTELWHAAFRGNTAVRGGGFANQHSAMIDHSTFDGNIGAHAPISSGEGGGLSNVSTHGPAAWVVVRNSTFSNNIAQAGGGILNRGSMTLINSTVSGNQALDGEGDGIAYLNSLSEGGRGMETLALGFTTVANNDGVGILRNTDGPLSLTLSLIAGNGTNCVGGVTTSTYSLDDGKSCELVGTGDQSGVDAMLGPLADHGGPTFTHPLLAGSPAIDGGRPSSSQPFDQRGVPRPLEAATDLGAYEFGMDPHGLMLQLPIGWDWLFRSELRGAVAFDVVIALSGPSGQKDGKKAARLVDVKAAKGQGQLRYEFSRNGRRLRVSGVAIPPKPGEPSGNGGPALFYLDVQRAIAAEAQLHITRASCDCKAKPRKTPPIVVPPYKAR